MGSERDAGFTSLGKNYYHLNDLNFNLPSLTLTHLQPFTFFLSFLPVSLFQFTSSCLIHSIASFVIYFAFVNYCTFCLPLLPFCLSWPLVPLVFRGSVIFYSSHLCQSFTQLKNERERERVYSLNDKISLNFVCSSEKVGE